MTSEPAVTAVIDGASWIPGGRLALRGQLPGDGPDDWDIVLCQPAGPRHVVAAQRDGSSFGCELAVDALPAFGDRLPLRDGCWQILLSRRPGQAVPAGSPEAARGLEFPGLGPAVTARTARPVVIGSKTYRCQVSRPGQGQHGARPARPVLTVTAAPALRWYERGRLRRRLLRCAYYPLQRMLPVRDTIVLISFGGRHCADNPRGIADELRRRGDSRDRVWVVSDWSVPVPDDEAAVLLGSAAYFRALGRCRYLIANDHMPQPYRKRSGQRYIQTWHGAPLKNVGYDISVPRSASGSGYLGFMAADVAQWDLLLSPNPFSTAVLRRAFRFGGEICETGYPRSDILHGPASAGRAGQVRSRLGLPPGKRVALYAPTWRDDQHDESGRYRIDFALDLDAAAERLGDSYVLLIRGHHLMASGLPARLPAGFAIDVSEYPDIADLLLVTDVLVTDYSSVIFDFAPAGRPIVFFTYDLARYRDGLRGFALDFEAEAPGPLLASSADVVAALADADSVAGHYRAALDRFARKYCPLDDGKSAFRACDRIFTG